MRSGLQRRLTLALGLVSLLLLVFTMTALYTLRYTIETGIGEAFTQENVSDLANEVAESALLSRQHEKEYLINVEVPFERARALKEWRSSNERLARAIEAFAAATTSDEDRRRIEVWRATLRFFLDGFDQATVSVESGTTQGFVAAQRLFRPAGDNLSTLCDMALTTSDLKGQAAHDVRRRTSARIDRVTWVLGALGATALLCATAWSVWFPRRLIQPILILREAATRLGEGYLATRAEVKRDDELGELSTCFNLMAGTIEQRTAEMHAQVDLAEFARREAEEAKARIAEQLATIQSQRALIGDLSVPILPLSDTTLVVPLVGELDRERIAMAEERVLTAVGKGATRFLILDITAVPVVDAEVADGLLRLVRSAALLGAHAVLVGIRPDVASSIVSLGVDLGRVKTERSLQSGIAYTIERARRDGRG